MKSIRQQLAMLVATAAVLPLLVYGLVSVGSLRRSTRRTVVAGNLAIASRGAEQIAQYVDNNVRILQSAAAELGATFLQPWQRERVLRNYVLTFPELRELTLFDRDRRVLGSSRLEAPQLELPPEASFDARGVSIAPVSIDDDLLPRTSATVRVDAVGSASGWLVGDLRLEELWRVVDRIRVGERGFAMLADAGGRLVAHGNPDEKARAARGEDVRSHPLARQVLRPGARDPAALEYTDARGRRVLAVAAPLPTLGWAIFVEQPADEAFAQATRLERQLLVAIALALAIMIGLGAYWGNSLIQPITALVRGTEAIAEGRLDTRVEIARGDEFRRLGDAFNSMAGRLVALQEETRRQERQAMFGRIAAGLVHDLSHPIQNVGNNCRLILRMHDDPEYRETFGRTVERELGAVRRVLDDLRNLARPMPLERFPVDVGRSVGEIVEVMQEASRVAGVRLAWTPPAEPAVVDGDAFALGRVYRNLIANAIQATPPGGDVRVTVERAGQAVHISVADTGCGIPVGRLPRIFDEFATTKHRGLGLGLPVSRKIVEQLGGAIRVASVEGRGATFTVELPLAQVPSSNGA